MTQEPELTTAELHFAITNGEFGTDWQARQAIQAHIRTEHPGLSPDEHALEYYKHLYALALGRLSLVVLAKNP